MEMSERGTDFASTFGIGGVIGTNFAWPGAPGMAETKRKKPLLTPEREQLWAKWTKLYDEKRLSQGEYLGGLYDIGFDRPEAHVVRKADSMHYAFFAPRFRRQDRTPRTWRASAHSSRCRSRVDYHKAQSSLVLRRRSPCGGQADSIA